MSANLSVNTQTEDPTIPTPTTAEAIITVANNQEPIIEPIVIPQDKSEKLKKCLASGVSSATRNNLQSITCGKCRVCRGIPEFKLIYHYDGIRKVEKYCTKCLKERIPNQEKSKEITSQMTVVESWSEYIDSLEKEQDAKNNHV